MSQVEKDSQNVFFLSCASDKIWDELSLKPVELQSPSGPKTDESESMPNGGSDAESKVLEANFVID